VEEVSQRRGCAKQATAWGFSLKNKTNPRAISALSFRTAPRTFTFLGDSKAFHRINHYILFQKPLNRRILYSEVLPLKMGYATEQYSLHICFVYK